MPALPAPATTPLRGGPTLRWGILAPGRIARAWAGTVLANTDQRIVAVASTDRSRAEAFAADFGVVRAYGSYDALLLDAGVDIVYIAALIPQHLPLALQAIAAGKHVLVEKPLAGSAEEAERIAAAAAAAGVFAGEAMWTRYLPQADVAKQLAGAGALGELTTLVMEFCQRFERGPGSDRVYAPGPGSGVTRDMGVYPLLFAHHLLGAPIRVESVTGTLTDEGVDERVVTVLEHGGGARSLSATALDSQGPWGAALIGTAGSVVWPKWFFMPDGFEATIGGETLRFDDPNGLSFHQGLCYQAPAVASFIAEGRRDSPVHPIADAVAVCALMDDVRARIGAV